MEAAFNHPDLQIMGPAILLMQLMSHGVAAYGVSKAKKEANEIKTQIPDLEFKITNTNDPAIQDEVLKEAVETGHSYLFRKEAYENPRKFAVVMTGEKGVLYSEPFLELGIKSKLKILSFYQKHIVESLDSEMVVSYLKALDALFANDVGLCCFPL